MKILLLSPPYLTHFMRNARCEGVSISDTQWYPIWLAYCGALLEREGHTVKLIDAPADKLGKEDVLKRVEKYSPELIVVYSSTRSLTEDAKLAEEMKALCDSQITFAGPWVTIEPQNVLRKSNAIESVCMGEFDYTVKEIAEDKKLGEIKGLVWKENGRTHTNPPRPPIPPEDLDKFPYVTDFYHRHLTLENYRVVAQLHPFIDLFLGRGCAWGQCTFCLWVHTMTKPGDYRCRSISNVAGEFKFVKEKIPKVKEIFIQDDMLSEKKAVELSKAIISDGLDVTWSCYVKGNLKLDSMKIMKEAGCRTLHVGYESASQTILNNINKGITVEQMKSFTEDANRAGLRIHADFVVGLPGETGETIQKTINWANTLDVDTIQYTIPVVCPTTAIYEELEAQGCIKDGEVSYPHMSNEEIRAWAKKGVRSYYLNPRFIKKALTEPHCLKFVLHSTRYALPAMFWKRW